MIRCREIAHVLASDEWQAATDHLFHGLDVPRLTLDS